MGVEASAVEIVIRVTDANSGAVIGSLTQNLDKLGAAGSGAAAKVSGIGNELTNLGRVGPPPLRWSSQAMREMGDHAQTSLDKVRLLRQELGIHVPRAMETLISRNEALMNGISKLGGLMAGFGFASIGFAFGEMVVKGVESLWHNVLDLNSALKEYDVEMQKAKHDDFGDTRSIETTKLRIDEATEAVKRYHDQAIQTAHKTPITWRETANVVAPGLGGLWDSYHQRDVAHGLMGQSVDAQRQLDELKTKRLPEQQHQANLDAIDLAHAGDARLRGEQKITAEKLKQHEIDRENMRFDANREGLYTNYVSDSKLHYTAGSKEQIAREKQDASLANVVAQNSGDATYGTKDKIADAKADADLFNLRRDQAQELAHVREQALEASLLGVALYRAQESAAIEDLRFKDTDSIAMRAAVHAKFHAEELKRLEEENREVAKMHEETQLAGLTGTARIQQEGHNRINDVYANRELNPGQRLAEIDDINKQTAQQIGQLNKSFKDRVDEIVGQSANRELQGFARIRADAQNQIRALDQEFQEKGGNPADLARGKAAINQGAAGQAVDLAKRNEEETEQIESQARVKFLDAEKQKTAAVESEYEQRLQKYKEELDAQEISQDDYNRRVAAAAQEANAEMVQAATEARQKMASQFDSFFRGMDHPLQYFRSLGDKVAGQAAASMVQRLQQHAQGTSGTAGNPVSGVFGDILGGFGLGGGRTTHLAPNAGLPAMPGGFTTHGSAEKMMSISQATIHVGSAMIVGGGGAAARTGTVGGGFGGGSSIGSTGSTSLYSAGSGFGGSGSSISGGSLWSGAGATSPGYSLPAATGGTRGGGVMGDMSQGFGLFKQARSIFSPGAGAGAGAGASSSGSGLAETTSVDLGGQFDKSGNWAPAKNANGGMLGGGGFAGNISGAASGALGVYSAYEGNGGVGGALSGAMSGMQLGMSLGGPIGAAIGAAGGAILGAIGMGGREKARVYDLKTVRPQMRQDTESYEQGGMDYLSAYSDLETLQTTAAKATDKMGPAAQSYYQDTIKPELKEAMGKLTSEQRAGRSMYTASAASYDVGSDYIPSTGFNLNHVGERIIPSDQNKRITAALETRTMPVQSQGAWSGDLHVHAIDAAGVSKFLSDNKHGIRAAVNDSLAENSGGGM